MKYFVYLSDAKLEMLYPQVGKTGANHQHESFLGFDLKILKGQVKETRGLDVTKYEKLNAVVRSLDQSSLVGTIGDDKPFIKGTLELAWDSLGHTITHNSNTLP